MTTRRVLPVAAVALLAVASVVLDLWMRAGAADALGGPVIPDGLILVSGAVILAQAALLWWRVERPVVVFASVVALDIVLLLFTAGQLSVGTVAVMVAAYTLWRVRGPRVALGWFGGLGLVSSAVAVATLGWGGEVVPAVWVVPLALARSLIALAPAGLLGEVARSRASMLHALRERAVFAEREQEHAARDAVRQERELMSRELHDIAAHHLTGIILGAQAAGALVATQPDRAREYIRTVGEDAQRTLANIRQTVGLLRPDSAGELTPVPAIDQLPELVRAVREGGMTVELVVDGDPTPLGPIAEVAAYRMVQESLTNARQHAPGSACAVRVSYGTSSTTLTVENGPSALHAPAGSGHGLLGMRERATLIGARLSTGPTPEGGWLNTLVIPPLETSQA